ncbi:hypothetical protein HGRIS_006253 [Hohenbuehelia grisea]|uniref:Fungal lipase-type domain-containing protein n=1 Tax=Hohenbuehelia grisea TaxID=104357 RepID=A0ABR3JZA4_9AGAR
MLFSSLVAMPDRVRFSGILVSLLALAVPALTAPTDQEVQFEALSRVATVTPLNTAHVERLEPYSLFAKATYCSADSVKEWTCGRACTAFPGFKPTLTGGDGGLIQFYFVGHWAQENTIVVAHQGTDPFELQSILTDLKMNRKRLNQTMFPGVPEDVTVHDGFRLVHEKTAQEILAEVKRLRDVNQSRKVALVGHSLGGALSALDALYLRLNLPADVNIKVVTYGTPRIGNAAFAKYFDAKIPNFKRINYGRDIIPIMPGRFLGYLHTKGEIHFPKDGKPVACPGNDNAADELCQIKSVPNILKGNLVHHLGPFPGKVYMGKLFCDEDDDSIVSTLAGIFARRQEELEAAT